MNECNNRPPGTWHTCSKEANWECHIQVGVVVVSHFGCWGEGGGVLTIEAQHSNSSTHFHLPTSSLLPPTCSSPLHREVAELRIPLIITSSVAEKYDEVALRSKPPIHFHFTDGEQGSISPLHSYQRSYLMSWRTNRCIALPHVMAYKQVHCIISCHGVQTGALHYLMS